MRVTTLFRQVLDVTQMWVRAVRFEPVGVVVSVVPSWKRPRCGECGKVAAKYDQRPSRRWRHLGLGSVKIWFEYAPRRVECPECGVRVESVPWAEHRSRFTRDFEELTAYLTQSSDKTKVTELMGISWSTVGDIVDRKVQVDEYSGYDALFTEGSGRTRVGCWAHCRRKFVEAEKSEPSRVQAVLRVVRKGYRLDSLMREKGYSHEDRLRVRDRIYRPAADNLRQRLIDEVHDSSILPRSKYGKALRYLVNHWENLEQPFLDGELELDNNGIESAIRPVAIGRKNWMHIGDVDAGDRAAIFYSLLVSCTRLGINPEEYLTDVLTRLPSCPASEIMELTPTEWKKARQLEQDAPAEETSSA